jgi:Flp pilus assembly protein TadG
MIHPRRLLFGPGSRRGQSLVEFAMVLPLLLVVGFIITEFGRALWIKNVLTQAARESCREAVVSTVSSDNKIAVAEARGIEFLTQAGTAFGSATVDAQIISVGGTGDDVLSVRVSQDFSFLPGGNVPTKPMAAGGDEVKAIGTLTIVGDAIMHLE